MSPLGFSKALIEQKNATNPLYATGLVRLLRSALSWLLMAALHLARSNAALGRLRRVQNVPLYCSQRPVYCYSTQTPSKTLHNTILRGKLSVTSEFAHGSRGSAKTPILLTVLHAALCSAGRCALLRAVQRWGWRCAMLRAVQRFAV